MNSDGHCGTTRSNDVVLMRDESIAQIFFLSPLLDESFESLFMKALEVVCEYISRSMCAIAFRCITVDVCHSEKIVFVM